MVFNGFWLVSMVFQGGFMVVSWFFVGFHGFSRWLYGFSWLLVGFHSFVVSEHHKLYLGPTIQSRPCPWPSFIKSLGLLPPTTKSFVLNTIEKNILDCLPYC